ncbi:hypothetical protein M426DRAFT_234227 [Hypoxylon sp. CI-4A]|nr:hypothetical protein M426DRAFT_234227 [Hypoxylon sp. CI-4A]
MASKEQSFSSNNPFRRKLGNNTPTVRTESPAPTPAPASTLDGAFDSTPRPPFTTFKSVQPQDERYDPNPDEEAASAQLKPKKVVKKVRVQSPPPSSPEDAVPVTRFPPLDDDDDYDDENEDENDDDDDDEDTDDGDSSDSRDYGENRRRLKGSLFAIHDGDSFEHTQTGPPANPFSKTLQDLEQTGKGQDTNTSAAKGNLDVNSFKRLLLTGHANIPGPLSTLPTASKGSSGGPVRLHPSIQDGASNTDASSVSRQSIFDAALQETPRTSHETSEPEDPDERKGLLSPPPISSGPSARKKPPPPSSRHGKLIKIELKADAESRAAKDSTPVSINTTSLPITAPPRQSSSQSITPLHSPFLPRDVNKPLPQTPFRPSVEEAVDSPFDREAIGKVPEPFADIQANPRSPTPPVATRNRSESNSSIQSRKPAAPPPRRHGRNDSKPRTCKNLMDGPNWFRIGRLAWVLYTAGYLLGGACGVAGSRRMKNHIIPYLLYVGDAWILPVM